MRLLPSHEGARPPPPPQKIPRPHIIQQNETLRALHNLLLPARVSESLLLCARQKSAALFPLLLELSFQQKHFQLGFEALPFQRILRRLSKPLAPESLPPLLLRAALSDLFQRFFPEIFKDSGVTIRAMDFFAKPSPKTPLIETSLCLRPLSAKRSAPASPHFVFSPRLSRARCRARAFFPQKRTPLSPQTLRQNLLPCRRIAHHAASIPQPRQGRHPLFPCAPSHHASCASTCTRPKGWSVISGVIS